MGLIVEVCLHSPILTKFALPGPLSGEPFLEAIFVSKTGAALCVQYKKLQVLQLILSAF